MIPAGSAGFAKYVRFGNQIKDRASRSWELQQDIEGTKVARMTGDVASVFAPLTKTQVDSDQVAFKLYAKDAGTLTVRINDAEITKAPLKVTAGWQIITVNAAKRLVEGENQIQLTTKSGGALAWMEIGGQSEHPIAFYDAKASALTIPDNGAMSWYVILPPNARVTADLADGACEIAVSAHSDDGATASGKLTGLGSAVELAGVAGKPVRLELAARGCPQASVAKAAVVVPGAGPVVKRGAAPKHVLLVIMDSLRADRIRLIEPKARPETPNFDKLADSSAVFVDHYSPGTESQVSHASMWSSLTLAKHRAAEMKDKLADKWLTIDEVAKKASMFTAAVSANGYIRPSRGFGPSWDRFVNHIEKGLGLRGRDVLDAGLGFIEPKKTQPWMLYVGLIDTHVTWRAKAPWIDKYDGGYKGRFEKAFGDDGPEGLPKDMTEREIDHVRALYDSNVSYQDDLLGKLIEKLTGWGVWDDTMLIITADHGDELWEDGKIVGHARSARDTVVHIPLIIRYPPLFPATRVSSGTEGIDLLPTIADALGVAADGEWQGVSLIPLANGAVDYPQLAMASHFENQHAGRLGSWKLVLSGPRAPSLYNLAADRGEKHDLWGQKTAAIAARSLLDPMWIARQWQTTWKKSAWGNPAAVTAQFATDLGE